MANTALGTASIANTHTVTFRSKKYKKFYIEYKKIQNYILFNYTKEQIETVINELLEDWKKAQ